jgi:predicted DNA-binding antitoxin AbrB/MazE fold protein
MTVPAKYENGVFRPLGQVHLEEGTLVEVVVPARLRSSGARPRSVREFEFCGMWQDRDDMADSVGYINRLRENLRG